MYEFFLGYQRKENQWNQFYKDYLSNPNGINRGVETGTGWTRGSDYYLAINCRYFDSLGFKLNDYVPNQWLFAGKVRVPSVTSRMNLGNGPNNYWYTIYPSRWYYFGGQWNRSFKYGTTDNDWMYLFQIIYDWSVPSINNWRNKLFYYDQNGLIASLDSTLGGASSYSGNLGRNSTQLGHVKHYAIHMFDSSADLISIVPEYYNWLIEQDE